MEREGICCFCGKQFINYGNDIRPLVTSRGNRCCDDCNVNIVIPNKLKFWDAHYEYVVEDIKINLFIDNNGLYTSNLLNAKKFEKESDCINYIIESGNIDYKLRRILLRVDN